jgi:hypothetical protein
VLPVGWWLEMDPVKVLVQVRTLGKERGRERERCGNEHLLSTVHKFKECSVTEMDINLAPTVCRHLLDLFIHLFPLSLCKA